MDSLNTAPIKRPAIMHVFLLLSFISLGVLLANAYNSYSNALLMGMSKSMISSTITTPIILMSIFMIFIWVKTYKGRKWARIITLVLTIGATPKILATFALAPPSVPQFAYIASGAYLTIAYAALICLFLPKARDWFDERSSGGTTAVQRIAIGVIMILTIASVVISNMILLENLQKMAVVNSVMEDYNAKKAAEGNQSNAAPAICSPDYAMRLAKNSIAQARKTNMRTVLDQINVLETQMRGYGIDEAKFEEYTQIVTAYSHLNMNDCDIPQDMEDVFYLVSFGPEDTDAQSGSHVCDTDAYAQEAQTEINTLKKSGEYAEYEDQALIELKSGMGDDDISNQVIDDLWLEDDFRETVIRASLQVVYRQADDCKNPFLPMRHMIGRIAKQISQNPQKYVPELRK